MTKPLEFETTIRGCGRCGGEHQELRFLQLAREIVCNNGESYDFWAACPATGEPVLLQWDVENRCDLPRAAQITENADLFMHLAKANRELGHAMVDLIAENRRLKRVDPVEVRVYEDDGSPD